jgi:TolA-binding protein
VNQAYYYIGLGHFQLGHYSRAIGALEKVGTTMAEEEGSGTKAEAGKRLFVKIEDADLSALEPNQTIKVTCKTTQGDEEQVECFSVGRNVRLVLGSILTHLGEPQPNNGILEVAGEDKVHVTYTDSHTADRQFDQPRSQEIVVVGDALVRITDGAYSESLRGAVLGRGMNIEVVDSDFDLTDDADTVKATVEVYREKTTEELEAEIATAAANAPAAPADLPNDEPLEAEFEAEKEENRLKLVDRIEVTLTEAKVNRDRAVLPVGDPATDEEAAAQDAIVPPTSAETAAEATPAEANATAGPNDAPAESTGNLVHSGVFRVEVPVVKGETAVEGNESLEALPGDTVQITYLDERNTTDGVVTVLAKARCLEGNLGGVRVTRAEISDQELQVQTQLKTAGALTNIGNRYKEFGLKTNADAKYQQALTVCEEISDQATRLGGKLLEETYVQLWHIYYEMDKLELAAAMCQRLEQEFPNSGFVDDALLQLAEVVRKQGDLQRAIGIFDRLVHMPTSQLRGEAQFGIAECYEEMASKNPGPGGAQLFDRAFQEYKKVFDSFPDSGRVGEAVSKMANYYYQQKDYSRAIDTFETVLNDHPDAKFLDVILFNYGRCLYRMERKAEARRQFDQLIADFPESPLATDAKKISEALVKSDAPVN